MKKFLLLLSILGSSWILTYGQELDIETYVTGLTDPVDIKNAGDDRLFVVERAGTIRIITANGELIDEPFLDISGRVLSGSERGLLSVEFHPDYSQNGFFYVNYTRREGQNGRETVIARYSRDTDNTADNGSELILLTYSQPQGNHNGGSMAFGPDNKLYISSGDGGGGGDQFNNGQNINTPLGALLRLDVDIPAPYFPSDNPFVGIDGNDAIWAYGLRNAWKFSFDFETENVWIADVGDNPPLTNEEVNNISNANAKGANFGWPCYEGDDPFRTEQCGNMNELTFPVTQYVRNYSFNRCSITGGYVYRGTDFPTLTGRYIFADYCSSELFLLSENSNDFDVFKVSNDFLGLSTFGVSNTNELFVASLPNGIVYRVVDKDVVLDVPENEVKEITFHQDIENKIVTVTFNSSFYAQKAAIEVFTLTGKNVYRAISDDQTSSTQLDLSFLDSGVYLLQFLSKDSKRKWVEKLVL